MQIAHHALRPRGAANVPVTIKHADGTATVKVDQRNPASIGGRLEPVGRYHFERGAAYTVTISNAGTTGEVVADAVQLVALERADPSGGHPKRPGPRFPISRFHRIRNGPC